MKNKEYIDISKAFSSSHLEKVGASTTFNSFVPINKIAELKGLKSTCSIRLATFLGIHYRSNSILGLRDSVYIRYSLFDLTKIHVYSTKGEFLCVARQVEKVHPMANHLGTIKDMEQFKQQIQKQQRQFKKAKKDFLRYFPKEQAEVIEIEQKEVIEIENFKQTKTLLKRKLNFREQQINVPAFNADYEK